LPFFPFFFLLSLVRAEVLAVAGAAADVGVGLVVAGIGFVGVGSPMKGELFFGGNALAAFSIILLIGVTGTLSAGSSAIFLGAGDRVMLRIAGSTKSDFWFRGGCSGTVGAGAGGGSTGGVGTTDREGTG